MTRLCVPIFVTDFDAARRDVALAAEAGADLVELRIDQLPWAAGEHEPLIAQLQSLIVHATVPCIVTLRAANEGGFSELPDQARRDLLHAVADNAAATTTFVDFEWAAFKHLADRHENAHYRRILSSHDFNGRPARLTNTVQELWESPAVDVAKIVWTARTTRDNLEAFELLRHRRKPTIALCMGEHGIISRILAKKFGAFLTFASLSKESATAPGQVTLHDLKRLYRWDAINPETKVYGVVASPVMHSMSPAIHNAAFDAVGHDGVYLPLLVNEGYESFKAFMETFLAFAPLHLSGLSVTLPHKENALRYLNEVGAQVEPLATQIGAVNTIVIDRGDPSSLITSNSQLTTLRGLNTDYAAILDSITDKLAITREQLANYRVAVLGAGGTGRTAVAALAHYGATVVLYNRTLDRAQALAAEFNGKTGKVVAAPLEKLCDSCCHIYLNCTSVGMYPNVDAAPFGDAPPKLGPDTVVFDTIYNPIETKLLATARAAGAKTIGGIEMFVRQAVRQFESWTNKPAPTDVMRAVVERRLGK